MVRVGIVGTGIIAREHANAIAKLPGVVSLAAAADLNPDRLGDFCKAYGVQAGYQTPEQLIADPNVDLVVIATPPSAHEAVAVAALEAGKYVLCEKPLAHNLASAARIAQAAARHPGKLSVSYQLRYGAAFRRLAWFAENGWLGRPKRALLERHSYIPHSDAAGGWWGSWKVAGGGVLITQLIHEIDLLIRLLGKPVRVSAYMDTRFTSIESEDYLEATIEFENGGAARCVASVNSGYLGGGLTIEGEGGRANNTGRFLSDNPSRAEQATLAADRALPDTKAVEPSLKSQLMRLIGRGSAPAQEPSPYVGFYRDIADAIANGRALPISADDAMTSLELCMALYQSALTGREVSLPLDPASKIAQGVSKEDYNARPADQYRRPRGEADQIAFPPPTQLSPKPLSVAGVKAGLRAFLKAVGLDPVIIRAMLRKPAPVHGGPRVRRWPWPQRRHFDARERRAAVRVLNKEIRYGGAVVYGGAEEAAYCQAFSTFLGGGYADAVNSGTNAMYIALRALDLAPGSEVVVPPTTDAGGTMPVVMNLCIPVAADADEGSVLTSAEQIAKVITPRTAAIVVTHVAGHPLDMDAVMALAAEHGIPVVEDCAQAHGSLYKGRMVGTFGAISAFSTMFGKQHATGAQGGVVFTRDATLFAKARQIADRGKAQDGRGHQSNMVASLNFNQGEIAMAIGQVQIAKLPHSVRERRRLASIVEEGLRSIDGVWMIGDPPNSESSYYYLMVRFDSAKISLDAQGFATALIAEGIEGVNAGYSVYPTDQPWHQKGAVFGKSGLPWSLNQQTPRQFELPNARETNKAMVRIDIHESLGVQDAKDIVAAIRKIARHFAKA